MSDKEKKEEEWDYKPCLNLTRKKATPGENDPLDEGETKLIAKMKELFPDLGVGIHPDAILIRFVRGYCTEKEPEKKTLETFRACLKWRLAEKVDSLPLQVLPKRAAFLRMWPAGLHGISRSGHPVWVDCPGKLNAKKLLAEFDLEKDLIPVHVQQLEEMNILKQRLSALQNQRVYKQVVILDMQGLAVSSFLSGRFRSTFKKFINLDQFYYPETLKVMILANCPWSFKLLWAIVSPFLDPITKAKIKWSKKEISKYIDPRFIPRFLGGKCLCEECLMTPFVPGTDGSDEKQDSVVPKSGKHDDPKDKLFSFKQLMDFLPALNLKLTDKEREQLVANCKKYGVLPDEKDEQGKGEKEKEENQS